MNDYDEHHSYDDDSYDGCGYCGSYQHDTAEHPRLTPEQEAKRQADRARCIAEAQAKRETARQVRIADRQGVIG